MAEQLGAFGLGNLLQGVQNRREPIGEALAEAWARLEYALSLAPHDQPEERRQHQMQAAFSNFESIANNEQFAGTKASFEAQTVLAFESFYVARAFGIPIHNGHRLNRDTLESVGDIMNQLEATSGRVADFNPVAYQNELLVMSLLLWREDSDFVPFPASPREERSSQAVLNHDLYIPRDKKIAIQVKTSRRSRNPAAYDKDHVLVVYCDELEKEVLTKIKSVKKTNKGGLVKQALKRYNDRTYDRRDKRVLQVASDIIAEGVESLV